MQKVSTRSKTSINQRAQECIPLQRNHFRVQTCAEVQLYLKPRKAFEIMSSTFSTSDLVAPMCYLLFRLN